MYQYVRMVFHCVLRCQHNAGRVFIITCPSLDGRADGKCMVGESPSGEDLGFIAKGGRSTGG